LIGEGANNMDPDLRGQAAELAAIAAATGSGTGGVREQSVLGQMPDQFFQNKAMIDTGQALSIAQSSQFNLAQAQLHQATMFHMSEMGLKEKMFELDERRLAQALMSADAPNVMKLIEEYGQALNNMSNSRVKRRPAEVDAHRGLVNALAAQLTRAGILRPQAEGRDEAGNLLYQAPFHLGPSDVFVNKGAWAHPFQRK
jgi:hypothetical protein